MYYLYLFIYIAYFKVHSHFRGFHLEQTRSCTEMYGTVLPVPWLASLPVCTLLSINTIWRFQCGLLENEAQQVGRWLPAFDVRYCPCLQGRSTQEEP